jgi:hypothetical protein
MSGQRFSSLADFWPYYVQEHSHPWTRRMHFIGNTNLLLWLGVAILRRRPALVGVAVVSSYALAWIGHFFIERNIPATFRYPLLSARADIFMYSKMLRGQMADEVARYARRSGEV